MTDHDVLVRALKRAVYTDKLLTMEDARKYCDLVGIPHERLTDV